MKKIVNHIVIARNPDGLHRDDEAISYVIPAKAGIQNGVNWMPAFAGMTGVTPKRRDPSHLLRTTRLCQKAAPRRARSDCRAAINDIAARNDRRTGFTLIEMMVVIGIIAVLIAFGMPAIRTMVNSLHTEGDTRALINSALSTARSIAERQHTYAGVRFQKVYIASDTELVNSPQYMIFIIHDFDSTQLSPGFRAVEGMEPIKLPESVGVMDLRVRTDSSDAGKDDDNVVTDARINNADGLRNATTFSIIFSSSGRLIMEDVRVRNRNGRTNDTSHDDIFNTQNNVENNGIGMFYQDDYANLGMGVEMGRGSFIIYNMNVLKKTDKTLRCTNYLGSLQPVYVNPYTGTIINNK